MTKPFFVCVNRLIERVKEKSLGPRRHGNGELRCDVIVSRLIDRINTANHCCYRQHTHTHADGCKSGARDGQEQRRLCIDLDLGQSISGIDATATSIHNNQPRRHRITARWQHRSVLWPSVGRAKFERWRSSWLPD